MRFMLLGSPFQWTDPRTWPWIVYVWLALIIAGWLKPLWRWIQRQRASGWPTAIGEIQSAAVTESKGSFISGTPRGKSPSYVAELDYSYSVAGKTEAGFYKRQFAAEAEASEFLRDLRGKPVSVQYNPNKPSQSLLSESSVESLLQTRAPKPQSESLPPADPVPGWAKPFLWIAVGLSAIGLVLSLWVHFGAVAGRRAPAPYFWILHVGIFVVWFPAVFVAKARVGNVNRKDFWKVVLQGSPDWMRYMVYGFLGYAVLNFALFMTKAPNGGNGANPPAEVWRGFSGHWMAFYSAALAILWAAARASDNVRRCLNGHPIPASANFCSLCGQPAVRVL
jgi:Protein of unknown function (DUF3592)